MSLDCGIHANVPMDDYIRDPAKEVSLNATIANLMIQRSPLHAWYGHPRLNPKWEPDSSKAADFGTVVHHMLLGADDRYIVVIKANDYRTKAAQEERDAAYAGGGVPILEKDYARAAAAVEAAEKRIEASEIAHVFDAYDAELTLIYEESGVWFRSRPDLWTKDRKWMIDVKTTTQSAEPNAFIRTMISQGYDVQAEIATRGSHLLTGEAANFVFVVIEQEPPYGVSLVSMAPPMEDLAAKKVDYAMGEWQHCMKTGQWVGYPSRICYAEPPAYHVATIEEMIAIGEQI